MTFDLGIWCGVPIHLFIDGQNSRSQEETRAQQLLDRPTVAYGKADLNLKL